GAREHFDFFVLSDTNNADLRAAEAAAWQSLCEQLGGDARVFYRWRTQRTKKKAGNVADFCRRWGRDYRYMVVLDADSVMTGDCLATLVRLMENNPSAGIIQTAPRVSGRDTLHARVQQFASRAYGPVYTAGMHFWQLGESHYWGHNAIIRVEPFMRHCALSPLPGKGPFSGEILSHDFVEAALMRRAGWQIWIAYDLQGSYEQFPPNLADELTRDRRWCHGNLQNFRLIVEPGLHVAHRAVFLTGLMAYLSSPLWLLFLVCSTGWMVMNAWNAPPMDEVHALWSPIIEPSGTAIALLGLTMAVLYVPRLLAIVLAFARGETAGFGGGARLLASTACEFALSALLAPIRMMFHAQFVLDALVGRQSGWRSPTRDDAETSWADAWRRHGTHTLIALTWGTGVWLVDRSGLPWLMPILGALAIAVPVSVLTSRAATGRRARALGLFVIPEENAVPPVLTEARRYAQAARWTATFADAVLDAQVQHACQEAHGQRRASRGLKAVSFAARVDVALVGGPQALTPRDRMALLSHPAALAELRSRVLTEHVAHPGWFDRRTSGASQDVRLPVAQPADVGLPAPTLAAGELAAVASAVATPNTAYPDR
ncbi:MAG TPA: glucans biosynthesis glucosyltransferase MdoH, partial [Burkholderiaceae bacterium]|nr:glucans biosynthesis glucosyltransferase MdoH [Burkholderiaceae bacterium]